MTEAERKQIRYQIASIQRTKVCNVYIENVQKQDTVAEITAKVKSYRIGCTYENGRITRSWRIV